MRSKRTALSEVFAPILERRRKERKLSRQALAELAGLHQTYVGLLERGLRNPTLDVADMLAGALGVPLSELVIEAESSRSRKRKRNKRPG